MDDYEITTYSAKELAEAVLVQAIEDWKELEEKGKTYISHKADGSFSLQEIEAFFNSRWCEIILESLRIKMSGQDFISMLRKQKEKEKEAV